MSSTAGGVVFTLISLIFLLAMVAGAVFLFMRLAKQARPAVPLDQDPILAAYSGKPPIVDQAAIQELRWAPLQQFDDVRQAGLDSTPLSGPFSPAWHRVFRGEVVRHLTALCAGKLLHYRGRPFLVTETYEVRYRIGGRRITENEALRLRAKKLVNLGVGETVREELEYTTHVMALLPRQFPNTEMQAVPNQRVSPDAEALGFVRVETGYPPFDQKWSVFSQDGAFVRDTFGPPALDYLLTAHRQGTIPMVLVLQDVMHMKTSRSVETLAFEPLVVHMSNLLAQLNPQIWNSAPPIAL